MLTACSDKRENALLILKDAEGLEADYYTSLVKKAEDEGYRIDTLTLGKNNRLGNELLKYKGVVLLADANQLPIQWQSDLERYVDSEGSLFLQEKEINTYKWSWLHRELNADMPVSGDERRVVSFSPEKLPVWEDFDECLDNTQIRKVNMPEAPDWNRFTKKVLDADVNEPMELGLLPSGKILFIEREGNLKLFNPENNRTKLLHTFEVSTEGNYEDGMLGITVDPNYKKNSWIYIYYSPYGGEGRQNLSRFYLAYEDSLILASEKIILEVPVQRKTCCHSGGSITFGPDGNLYLSTGDNTSSKESDGYSPLDERPGRGPYDAQKSSSNTQDLRGKILRITPTADGSYTIPDGNLFPKDGSQGRPEIYAMGVRNPFRFSVDAKNGYLYWGDVGPDSGEDSELGPRSYDEWNQARTPGNYGWPYFVGNNKAYPMLDFATGELGPPKDPDAPTNLSPNNSGEKLLPPARTAMIWYPYAESSQWPMLGQGSRSAMAGPVYYQPRGKSAVKFPAYYNGKLFIYEWARSWIKVVSFDENGDLKQIEEFLPDEEFVKPIDMEFGEDGAMYLLEYGANYFANNVEARLVKIEYAEGNRLPVPKVTVSKKQGAAPFEARFSAEGTYDYDENDSLQFVWEIEGNRLSGKEVIYTFENDGKIPVQLIVKDQSGDSAVAAVEIAVGNEPPVIDLQLSDNQSFYFGRNAVDYKVVVSDKEDGSTANGSIDPAAVSVNFNYLKKGNDLALMGEDFFKGQVLHYEGKLLMEGSDCASCHDLEIESIGPSYLAIAEKYRGDYGAPTYLAQKVIRGGNGVWGEKLMAAHPQHTEEETLKMVNYILSLGQETTNKYGLSGTLQLDQHEASNPEGKYVLSVRYTDKGTGKLDPATASKMIIMGPPVLEAEEYSSFYKVQQQRPQGGRLAYVSNLADGSFIGFEQVDLSNIKTLKLTLRPFDGGVVHVRVGDPQGKEVGILKVAASQDEKPWESDWTYQSLKLNGEAGVHDLYFVFSGDDNQEYLFDLDKIEFLK